MSMRAKVAAILLCMIAAASGAAAVALWQVAASHRSVTLQGETLQQLRTASAFAEAFRETRYWHIDMVTSLSAEAEEKATTTFETANTRLKAVATFAPELARQLGDLVTGFHESAMTALDHFMFEERQKGNEALADVRQSIQEGNRLIEVLIGRQVKPVMVARTEAQTRATWALRAAWVLIAVVVVSGFAAWATVYATAVRPLGRLTRAVNRLTAGDLEAEVPYERRQDEIGLLAQALDVFRGKAQEAAAYAREQETQSAAQEARSERLRNLTDELNAAVTRSLDEMAGGVGGLRDSAGNLGTIAGDNETRAGETETFAGTSADNASEAATAAGQLQASMQEIAERAGETSTTTREVRDVAETTSEQVKSLEMAANNITSIVTMIQEIAEKTNLLALNATIEAARAGEAGKGFAVVAGEVKNLARQTASATQDIAGQVRKVQDETSHAVEAINRIAGLVDGVDQSAAAISSAVTQQQSAVEAISGNMRYVTEGSERLRENIGEIKGSATDTRHESDRVIQAVEDVQGQSTRLRDFVAEMVGRLRAA